MTGTTLVTACTVDITRQVLKLLVPEEVAGVLLFSSEQAHTVSLRAACRVVECLRMEGLPSMGISG
jgi:hypothetical protein